MERDEDRQYFVRGKMSGGSLGIRTGSYGTLAQNGGSSHQILSPFRKPSRASVSGSREKERYLLSIYKCLGRRKVGMLILVVFALLAFITGFFSTTRGLLCYYLFLLTVLFLSSQNKIWHFDEVIQL